MSTTPAVQNSVLPSRWVKEAIFHSVSMSWDYSLEEIKSTSIQKKFEVLHLEKMAVFRLVGMQPF